MNARQELLEFWAQRAEVHGSAFDEFVPVRTCPDCYAAVPADQPVCPLCGWETWDANLDAERPHCAASGSPQEEAGWRPLLDIVLTVACWFFLGVSLRFWLVGAQVEWFRFWEWVNG